ncbi:unnamed protein product [Symbiodinium sp. CCMP2592]|nr:unnamed protein product [Symbiodinium sp. CCMP2592]
MTPVLTPRAWLALREDLLRNSKAMHWIAEGATWCVDVKWCELARTAVLGLEAEGEPDVSIEAAAQKLPHQQRGATPREPSACMVFYQTPVRHHNFQSLKKSKFELQNEELCGELAVGLRNTTLRRVYRTFHESDLRASSLAKNSALPTHLFCVVSFPSGYERPSHMRGWSQRSDCCTGNAKI